MMNRSARAARHYSARNREAGAPGGRGASQPDRRSTRGLDERLGPFFLGTSCDVLVSARQLPRDSARPYAIQRGLLLVRWTTSIPLAESLDRKLDRLGSRPSAGLNPKETPAFRRLGNPLQPRRSGLPSGAPAARASSAETIRIQALVDVGDTVVTLVGRLELACGSGSSLRLGLEPLCMIHDSVARSTQLGREACVRLPRHFFDGWRLEPRRRAGHTLHACAVDAGVGLDPRRRDTTAANARRGLGRGPRPSRSRCRHAASASTPTTTRGLLLPWAGRGAGGGVEVRGNDQRRRGALVEPRPRPLIATLSSTGYRALGGREPVAAHRGGTLTVACGRRPSTSIPHAVPDVGDKAPLACTKGWTRCRGDPRRLPEADEACRPGVVTRRGLW